MKVNEVTQPKVSRVTGNEIEIDQGDGVTTTIDRKKNPDALQKDPRTGQVAVRQRNSAQKSNSRTQVRPGDKVDPETLSNAN